MLYFEQFQKLNKLSRSFEIGYFESVDGKLKLKVLPVGKEVISILSGGIKDLEKVLNDEEPIRYFDFREGRVKTANFSDLEIGNKVCEESSCMIVNNKK